MQDKTRYVSIQVGIGGWQPFEAELVHKTSYGDCKALSNYMKALLKAVNIKSNYTLIRAGRKPGKFRTHFPSNQFNHAILCVPLEADTIWLECTSQRAPFGYLGTFTDDRPALLITDDGGKLVNTPAYTINDHCQETKAWITLNSENTKAEITRSSGGLFYDQMTRYLYGDEADRKKYIDNNINISNFKLVEKSHKEVRNRSPRIILDLSLNIPNYCTELGKRLIVPLNPINKTSALQNTTNERLTDIHIQRSKQYIDTIYYSIPEGYTLSQLPGNFSIEKEWGSYNSTTSFQENKLIYTRRFILNKGTYAKSEIENYTSFFEQVEKQDNAKFMLMKNQ